MVPIVRLLMVAAASKANRWVVRVRIPCLLLEGLFGRAGAGLGGEDWPTARLASGNNRARDFSQVRKARGLFSFTQLRRRLMCCAVKNLRYRAPLDRHPGRPNASRMDQEHLPDPILIVDFGSQVT